MKESGRQGTPSIHSHHKRNACVCVCVCWLTIALGQTWLLLLRLCPNCRAGKPDGDEFYVTPVSQTRSQTWRQTYILILQFHFIPQKKLFVLCKVIALDLCFLGTGGFHLLWHPDFHCVLVREHVCKTEGLLRDVVPVGDALARCECCIRHLCFPATQQGCGLMHLPPHSTLLWDIHTKAN